MILGPRASGVHRTRAKGVLRPWEGCIKAKIPGNLGFLFKNYRFFANFARFLDLEEGGGAYTPTSPTMYANAKGLDHFASLASTALEPETAEISEFK